ncbi:hypothetical protein OIDMADRAFT_106925 [Oidiodendron maius Zn]|uniref:Peptidase S33 tripeptidyl aminopeptidase-like C-terminal domain-containing protein n=1 Tax=Oidiodendron maius (strain Zn) TaxID=913774 RepID=A0A0C3GAZ2_OIDMZ|nr:hypothetical protein OIDMADRAFT_106925 [Oidiodendron maius Zn]
MYFPFSLAFAVWDAILGESVSLSKSTQLQQPEPDSLIWDQIAPSTDLHFHSCYTGFECARLDVPLDWNKTSSSAARAAVAIVKLPAQVDVNDPRYGGSILINPGGPGGSGVNLALLHGRNIQRIVDSPISPDESLANGEKYFDIIGFDPRSVGFTTPSFTCFSDPQQRRSWQIASEADGLLGSSDAALGRMWARKHALAETCYAEMGDEAISFAMNTPVVAMDMVAIVDSLSRWRRQSIQTTHPIRSSQTWMKDDPDKLQYWGFSYGTLLGQTFASMYPHLVGRVVLDGVVDSDRHYSGTWDGNIVDADAIIQRFSVYCYEAGPERCDLFSEKGPASIQSSLDSILASVRDRPKSVSSTKGPEIITYSDVEILIRDALYGPFKAFENLAIALQDLASGDGSFIASLKQNQTSLKVPSGPPDYAEEVVGSISCSDGADQTNMTESEFVEYWHKARRQSRYLGDRWSQNRLQCIFWKFRPQFTHSGPIGVQTEPILFIGNTLDPVTSIENARRMNHKFPGSKLLQQESEGHISLSTPSLCTAKVVRAYFQSGVLPDHETSCQVYELPFGLPGERAPVPLDKGDKILLEALRTIANQMW